MPLGANKAAIMGVAGVSTGDVVLLSSQTASNSTSIDFTSGITSTYGEYIFKFYNINPATNSAVFGFDTSTDGGSNYASTKTTTGFAASHGEDDGGGSLGYDAGYDIQQGTGDQLLGDSIGNGGDESLAGELHLFNPSSATYVKQFYARTNIYVANDYVSDTFVAGYINQTADVDAVQFKMNSGNFDGTIKMWGVK